jgi:hypothetical protein
MNQPADWDGTHLEPFLVDGFTVEAWTSSVVASNAPIADIPRPKQDPRDSARTPPKELSAFLINHIT